MPPGSAAGARRSALSGIALTVGACACFALLDMSTKLVGATVPLFMALWLRYLFQSLLTSAWVLPRTGWRWPRTQHPRFQMLRAALFAGTSLFGFLSIRFMPLPEFTAIVAATPLCVTLVAALWLRQPVSPLRWVLVATGLASVMLILRPGGSAFTWAMVMPLAMLALATGYQILSSLMAGQEDPATTQFYTGWIATALTSLGAPFVWTHIASPWVWLGTFVMGLSSALGHLMLLRAYARTTPATIAPFLYTQIGFAMLAGWAVYGHMPDGWSLVGMGLIAASGAASAWLTVRETR
ncbi:DMT family transporter [Alicycliphilus denitrificans]|uniref:DMT family transporter n=1 Tax=Alicycliphilus denitrificans TaxID=179636 RepID=A0A3R7LFZ7_9BURK|nr:DMT family transporter [Alicycliphilus denitrificans]RKJ97251.1 DMT family transporter [Alicycliphilus denitrificans]HRO81397.1 DMT family transporter [Alicycliphilus denitrificans]